MRSCLASLGQLVDAWSPRTAFYPLRSSSNDFGKLGFSEFPDNRMNRCGYVCLAPGFGTCGVHSNGARGPAKRTLPLPIGADKQIHLRNPEPRQGCQ